MRGLLFALVAATAGCLQASDAGEFRLHGTFTEDASQDDVREFQAIAAEYGKDAAILESFPMQFDIRGLAERDCAPLRARLAGLAYVARVDACQDQG